MLEQLLAQAALPLRERFLLARLDRLRRGLRGFDVARCLLGLGPHGGDAALFGSLDLGSGLLGGLHLLGHLGLVLLCRDLLLGLVGLA